jgi:hypothetical protein
LNCSFEVCYATQLMGRKYQPRPLIQLRGSRSVDVFAWQMKYRLAWPIPTHRYLLKYSWNFVALASFNDLLCLFHQQFIYWTVLNRIKLLGTYLAGLQLHKLDWARGLNKSLKVFYVWPLEPLHTIVYTHKLSIIVR